MSDNTKNLSSSDANQKHLDDPVEQFRSSQPTQEQIREAKQAEAGYISAAIEKVEADRAAYISRDVCQNIRLCLSRGAS
ncbi:hypothetical protein [Marinobacter orientalis]|uniref:Uncharacterized protein n=1 Tax=Marinobacter orientalis TaxID=1928859 RepID=A0A7Y0WS55_9GAMM|nr:hypothetical protein [Marinobacter orientalis]NMT63476.1 hypothetical protein [Marinobacter orientalis]TGX48537.1 hypothetical protein DIT72_14180 [Marinobacter orientalis]